MAFIGRVALVNGTPGIITGVLRLSAQKTFVLVNHDWHDIKEVTIQ